MVRIRMKAMGRRHRPFYRICAMDARTPRDGRAIEELGWYDPLVRNPESREHLDASRIRYWLSVGAQPSEKVAAILKRLGVKKPAPGESWELPEDQRVRAAAKAGSCRPGPGRLSGSGCRSGTGTGAAGSVVTRVVAAGAWPGGTSVHASADPL